MQGRDVLNVSKAGQQEEHNNNKTGFTQRISFQLSMQYINSLRNLFFCASPAEKTCENKTRRNDPAKKTSTAPSYYRHWSHQAWPKQPRGENRQHKSPSLPIYSKSLSPILTFHKFVLQSYPASNLIREGLGTGIPACRNSSLWKAI